MYQTLYLELMKLLIKFIWKHYLIKWKVKATLSSTTLQGYWISPSFFRVDRVHRGVGPWASYNRHTLVSFWLDQLVFSGARELKDKLTCLAWWGWPALAAGLSLEGEARSTVWSQNPGKTHPICLWCPSRQSSTNGYLWQHKRISCHGLGKQRDWWLILTVMPWSCSGQSDLSKGALPCPGWAVIILFSYLRCFNPSSLALCWTFSSKSIFFLHWGSQNWIKQSTYGPTRC